MQALRTQKGFHTLELLDRQGNNEAWIMHIKLLKRSAHSSINLFHQVLISLVQAEQLSVRQPCTSHSIHHKVQTGYTATAADLHQRLEACQAHEP